VEESQHGSEIRNISARITSGGQSNSWPKIPHQLSPPAGELSEDESSKLLVVNKMGR
jgi:hypothetical protein